MTSSRTFLDHTADILFQAEGTTLPELFEQCALAVEESQIDLSKLEQSVKKEWRSENPNLKGLLFDFLDDLLFYKDTEQLLFNKFDIDIKKGEFDYKLNVVAYGDILDVKKHQPKVDVKAITMHLFELQKTEQGWKAQVLIDI